MLINIVAYEILYLHTYKKERHSMKKEITLATCNELFPFLQNCLHVEKAKQIFISEIDNKITQLYPCCNMMTGVCHESIYLINKDGAPFAMVGNKKNDAPVRWYHRFIKRSERVEFDEDLGQAIKRIGDISDQIKYIVCIFMGNIITIHYAPKNLTLHEWLKKISQDEVSSIRSSLVLSQN